jgi:hypothetical protein
MLKEEIRGLNSRRRPINIRNITPQIYSTTLIKNLTLQGDSISFRKVKEEKKMYSLTNTTIVIRWEILLKLVELEGKNTIRETKGTMPIQLNMMSHPRR